MESPMKLMKTVALTHALPQSADSVWRLVRSGANVQKLMPTIIDRCRVEGSGAGARRFCTTKQGPIDETILCVDDGARLFRYRIDRQSMMPLEHYEGSVHVADLGADGCEVLWFATYDLLDEGADTPVREGLLGLFRTAIDGMGPLAGAA